MTWQDPPATDRTTRPGSYFRQFVAELQKNPGCWAVYGSQYKTKYPAAMFRSRYSEMPQLEWADSRADDGTATLYARWMEQSND